MILSLIEQSIINYLTLQKFHEDLNDKAAEQFSTYLEFYRIAIENDDENNMEAALEIITEIIFKQDYVNVEEILEKPQNKPCDSILKVLNRKNQKEN